MRMHLCMRVYWERRQRQSLPSSLAEMPLPFPEPQGGGMNGVLRGCSGAAIPWQGVSGPANGSRGPSRGIIRSEGDRIAKTNSRDRISSTAGFPS